MNRARPFSRLPMCLRSGLCACLVLAGLWAGVPAGAEERFPPPEFSNTHHEVPMPTRPAARESVWSVVDVAVLAGMLGVAAWLVLKKRSRRGVFVLMAVSIAYFGFYREGCVCPIGSIQNVSQAVFNPGTVLPLSVLAIFFLPLIGTLLFGRVYCSSVCPHGALQDAVAVKPVQLPRWVNDALGLFPWLYLGLGVLFAATGAAYVICEYDPFIALFRLDGSLPMLLFGGLLLGLGMFVGRPYCRFLCPYGAILRVLSSVSFARVKIYPDRCIDCRLCDSSCPYGAIRPTTPVAAAEPRPQARRRLVAFLFFLPVLILIGGWGGGLLAGPLSRMHPDVQLAETLVADPTTTTPTTPADLLTRDRLQAVRQQNRPAVEIRAAAAVARGHFQTGAWLLGAFLGLIVGLKAIALAVPARRVDYAADRGSCVACARCFDYCPGEKGLLDPAIALQARRL